MSDEPAFLGDESVPKSYIRKVFTTILENPDASTEDKLKAADLLSKLEGYTGRSGTSQREALRIGVMIMQKGVHKEKAPRIPSE